MDKQKIKSKLKKASESDALSENVFLPDTFSKRKRKRILKRAFTREVPKQKMWNDTSAMPKRLAKKIYKKKAPLSEKLSQVKHRERRNFLKLVPAGLSLLLMGYLISNNIRAGVLNNELPSSNPFTADRVFDDNDEDLEIKDGQIVFDKMNKEEKALLLQNFSGLVLKDANARIEDSNDQISSIKDVLSVSLLPSNMNDETNEFDKYYVSILFQDEDKDLYTLNYLTGKDFESDAETTKQYFIDFINYLNFDCALDNCSKMNETAKSILSKTENAIFVGEAYWGFRPSGVDCYFVPIYFENGGVAYSAPAAPIDSYEQNPLEVLENQFETNQEEPFTATPFTESENLQNIVDILHEQLLTTQKQDTTLEK